MAISFSCWGCGKRMQSPDHGAGKKARCPQCGRQVQIPDNYPAEHLSDIEASETPEDLGIPFDHEYGPYRRVNSPSSGVIVAIVFALLGLSIMGVLVYYAAHNADQFTEVGKTALSVVVVGMVVLISLGLYFLPTIVACARNHRNKLAIFVLNLFLGWTFLGWVIALVWSCTHQKTF